MSIRLLIVDDEPMIIRGLRHIIERLDIPELDSIHSTTSPREALRIAREISPDVVLTDVKMPGISGLELIQKMRREAAPLAQYVVISGYDEFKLVREALHLQAIDYLLKPAKTSDLQRAIVDAVNRAAAVREEARRSDEVQVDLQRSFLLEMLSALVSGRHPDRETLQRTRSVLRRHAPVYGLLCGFVDARDGEYDLEEPLVRASTELGPDRVLIIQRLVSSRSCAFVVAQTESSAGDVLDRFEEYLRLALGGVVTEGGQPPRVAALSSRSGDILTIDALYAEANRARALKLTSSEPVVVWQPLENRLSEAVLSRRRIDLLQSVRMYRMETAWAIVDEIVDEIVDAERLRDLGDGAPVRALDALEEVLTELDHEVPDLRACFSYEELRQTMKLFLSEVAEGVRNHASANTLEARVERFVMTNLDRTMRMQEVADSVGLSYAYFSSLFKETVGVSFSQYLLRIRMQEAHRLLGYAELSVEEVATRVGYKSPKHFSRVFHSYFNVRPSDLRSS